MVTPKKIIMKDLELADEEIARLRKENKELKEENMNLNEFKVKREESMFYFKALMERAEPKTAREAEDLYRAKEIFEGLYRQELYCLEKENKELKANYNKALSDVVTLTDENKELKEKLDKFRTDNIYEEGLYE